ncbi:MAG: molybdopterin-dependent oxidoreductase, partial [Parvularcula sp.]|nr:molybdopterin-dependent oxidoreductase [Parvularcula sp.]
RLDRPYIREGGKLRAASWEEAFGVIAAKLETTQPQKFAAIAGDLVPAEAVKALKDLTLAIGSPNLDCRQDGGGYGVLPSGERAPRESYLFAPGIAAVEEADAILLVGTNPRIEAPLLNARIRKAWLHSTKLKVGVLGENRDLTYQIEHLGAGTADLTDLSGGKHSFFETLKNAERPMIIVGAGALTGGDAAGVMASVLKLAASVGAVSEGWHGLGVLHNAAARVGALDLGFLPQDGGRDFGAILEGAHQGEIEVVYNLGCDEADLSALSDAFVVYQGHHGDQGARYADVILPGAAYAEQPGLYVNTEGRVQMANRVYFPFGEAKDDWAILRALSERIGKTLPYDDLFALRQAMIEEAPTFGALDTVEPPTGFDAGLFGEAGDLPERAFGAVFEDYYFTNPIARASAIMAECSETMGAGRKSLAAE